MQRTITAVSILFCLAACGGGGGGGAGSGIDPRLARLDIYEAQKLRVLGDPGVGVPGMQVTDAADVPTAGTMAFTGSGTMRIERNSDPIVLFGDARLDVNFAGGTATGAIENTFGTNRSGDIVDYTGAITLQSASTNQNMPLSYQGALRAGSLDLAFDGTMTGLFLGNPTAALSAADLEAEIDQNGQGRTGTIVVTLEETQDPS